MESGEWTFEAEETSSGFMFSVYDAHGQRLTDPYTGEAVAHLIAASPDMLEALQACATILPHYHMRGETTGHDESLTAVLERVQEAIALATGKDRDFGGKGKSKGKGGHHGKR